MTRSLMTSVLALTLASPALAVEKSEVIDTYADIAEAAYGDSLITAQALVDAVDALIAEPSADTMQAARTAWLAARVPYQQTEAYRFGNPIVDDWEGKLNAWPLDEGLIDYVDASYGGATDENAAAALNVIANPTFTLSGTEVDASTITPDFLAETLHEADGNEANVASGYHAVEFLLWGQDLNGTKAGAGDRPFTDYAQGNDCTNGNCDRRAAYLKAALAGRRQAIKLLLLDQRIVAGLGNIYVCEALWRARISPRRAGGRISLAALERLVAAIREVLEQSIRDGGSSLRDYARPDGELGYFATRFEVYGRTGEDCRRADDGRIARIEQGGRSTWYCPVCQR
mgnify:CR=1 FL=1